jgi:NADH-quinone oxidoreductase subunit G
MLELEIDGVALQVEDGSTVIEAAHKLGTYIPHFCYHKKLSIAANCRMCLVQVEKAPKPMPACATPVTNGMKVFTHSELAVKAQKGVMEFLLINHPLDCPICDQGGECQLQDLAVGYGDSASKYTEEKRVVSNKNLGPLVSTDMTRCINCTRCIRFTQEIAGLMELGQAFRGEHAEVMAFVGETVNSELSGNIIDICPVGALTSKPFRFAARTWELSRRKSISPHDGLGSNLIVQTKHDRVLRVLPRENEGVNECWLSDKDRYSYEGLNSEQRVTRPMIKQDGRWNEVDWSVALDYVSHALRDVATNHTGSAIGALVSPQATLEEMYLTQKLVRGLGSENIDFRLRQTDFSADQYRTGTPWLGMRISDISLHDRVLVVGSFLRKDHPLFAQRLRQSAKRGTQISFLNCSDDDNLVKTFAKAIALPSELPLLFAQVLKACLTLKAAAVDSDLTNVVVSAHAQKIAESLVSGRRAAILLGNFAQHHSQNSALHKLALRLSKELGASFGFIGEAANSVGGYVAKAIPGEGGLNAAAMLAQPRRAYVVVGAEPELDCANGAQALAALKQAASVVMLTSFHSPAMLDYADVLLPGSPFSETSGTFVNTEGRAQSFHASTKPLAESRPSWKVLRVLGNLLGLTGFEFTSSEEVKAEALNGDVEFVSGLENGLSEVSVALSDRVDGALERIADVPIYFADPLVRRSSPLQQTQDALPPSAQFNAATLARLGIDDGATVRVGAGDTLSIELVARKDDRLPNDAVRIPSAHQATIALGPTTSHLTVERA